jgi:hypothetical protein
VQRLSDFLTRTCSRLLDRGRRAGPCDWIPAVPAGMTCMTSRVISVLLPLELPSLFFDPVARWQRHFVDRAQASPRVQPLLQDAA